MPRTAVSPDTETFGWFQWNITRRGFRKISRADTRSDFKRLDPQPPSPRKGREVGFRFWARGLQVVVWTTYLEEEQMLRKKDCAWVLIKDGDIALYYKQVRRTKYFFKNLLRRAAIAKARVENRPLCPVCSKRMQIMYGKGLKSRYWCCSAPAHSKPVRVGWDHGLPKEVIKCLEKERRKTRRYRRLARKAGKKPGSALLNRTGWKFRRPENIVSEG